MKIIVCYIAVANRKNTEDFCARFVSTYNSFPPQVECDLMVIANGGPLPTSTSLLFAGLNVRLWPRTNDEGYDISAYIDAARGPCADYDMMLCLGESNYFHREGWLKRLVEAWKRYGPGMYGPYATNVIRAHLQTTAFACHPAMLKDYPRRVACKKDRYEFEHGERALWRRLNERQVPVKLVTWDGEWDPRTWRVPRNILWRGDQSNLLMWCNHSDKYAEANLTRKASWSRSADRPYK